MLHLIASPNFEKILITTLEIPFKFYIWFVNVGTSRYIGSHLQFVSILMLQGNLTLTLWFGVHKLVQQTNVQHLNLFEMKIMLGSMLTRSRYQASSSPRSCLVCGISKLVVKFFFEIEFKSKSWNHFLLNLNFYRATIPFKKGSSSLAIHKYKSFFKCNNQAMVFFNSNNSTLAKPYGMYVTSPNKKMKKVVSSPFGLVWK